MNELALFAGTGGGILGGKLLGWRTVLAVEIEPGARAKLAARQNDGCLEACPIWDDVRSFTVRNRLARPAIRALRRARNRLVITGGFPCQGISMAGDGEGLEDDRSGLWSEQARIIGEIRPLKVVVENSPALTFRGGLRVVGDLAALGYDCRWGIISAADAIWADGTPCLDHLRERIWIVGTRTDRGPGAASPNAAQDRRAKRDGEHDGRLLDSALREGGWHELGRVCPNVATPAPSSAPRADADEERCGQVEQHDGRGTDRERPVCAATELSQHARGAGWWQSEPSVGRVADGVADRVDRLYGTGNGQVPAVVRLAWHLLNPET